MKKTLLSFAVVLIALVISAHAADVTAYGSPVPAEVVSEKAFVRADHSSKAKRVSTLEEGDALDLLAQWDGGDAFPWYKVETDEGEGWIYGQNIQRLDGKPMGAAQGQKNVPEPGVLGSDGNYVTVVARGQGTDRAKALEQAWIEAVRLAVGATISSKSELNNDEFAENTIAHSRGVIEGFDILDEKNDGKRAEITIQSKVRKETLVEVAKTYEEAQIVKAQTGEAVKTLLEDKVREESAELEKKTGLELVKEVLEAYPPEMFYSAALDPKIYLNKDKKAYLNIVQKFNEDLFWKEFLPKLRTAMEGVAAKKEKRKYESAIQQANQKLAKERFAASLGIYSYRSFKDKYGGEIFYNTRVPYSWSSKRDEYGAFPLGGFVERDASSAKAIALIIPEDNSDYVVYYLPYQAAVESERKFVGPSRDVHSYTIRTEITFLSASTNSELHDTLMNYLQKTLLPIAFYVTYIDREGYEIHTQQITLGPVFVNFSRSFFSVGPSYLLNDIAVEAIPTAFAFSPGFVNVNEEGLFDLFLDTTTSSKEYPVVLDEGDLQKVDSMRFEYVFENL
jgi:hypothetical protein